MLKDQRRAEPARVPPSDAPLMLDAAGLSLAALAGRVRRLGGWKKRTTALLAGAASVLAMAPFFAWPVLWVTLPILVWLIDGATWRAFPPSAPFYRRGQLAAAEVGFWFAFGYLLAG